MKTKETSNYLGCKTPDDESTREQAITWWDSLSDISIQMPSKSHLCKVYHGDMRIHKSLTGREIEEIYNKEVLEPKRQKEWQESQVNCRYTKPNAKEFKQFDESLFKAYIDKFSTEDLYKALKIIGQKLGEFSE